MKRIASLAVLTVLALAQPATLLATTEGPAVQVALVLAGPATQPRLDAVLMNKSSSVVAGRAELELPSGVTLQQGQAAFDIELPPGGSVARSFALAGEPGRRGAAVLTFRPAGNPESFSRGRLFLLAREGALAALTLEEAIDADTVEAVDADRKVFEAARLPRPLDAPTFDPSGQTGVKGRLLWYDALDRVVPGRFVSVELVPAGGGAAVAESQTGDDGSFTLTVTGSDAAGQAFKPRFVLGNERWMIKEGRAAYSWDAPEVTLVDSHAVDAGEMVLPKGQPASEAAWIHGTLARALDAFRSRNIDIGWWTQVGIRWPSSGDFYSWGTVNLTEPHQWDVIGHEFGHAVFHIGTSSRSTGGQHKIDECYSNTLAWSEGFATFFAGVCHLERDDADAKFQFLVPRRAPIRLEHVPADVCMSERNEWRVAAALWDLYDTSADGGDAIGHDFDRIWEWMRAGNRMGSLTDYWHVAKPALGAEAEAARGAMEQSGVTLD